EAELALMTLVSDNYFPLLGVEAARGRLFRDDLDRTMQNQPAVVISDSLWRRRFGADPGLIGRTMRMNESNFTVVGILPPEFRGLVRALRNDIWVPVSTWKAMGRQGELEARGPGQFDAIARLRPGVSLARAQAQLETVGARWQREYPQHYRGRRLFATTEAARQSERGGKLSMLLLAIVGLVVLIACANVAVLLLAQSEARRREIGIRAAMGASRGRIVRQLLTESVLLAASGGLVALLITRWMIPLLDWLLPPGPDFLEFVIRLDARVAAVTVLTCMATVLLFGLAPAIDASRTDVNAVIKTGGLGPRRRFAGRSLLVITQAALGVVLVTAAGLLARSFLHTQSQRAGFDTDKEMLALIAGIGGGRNTATATCDAIAERLRALPGVKRAAYCRRMPMSNFAGTGATRDIVIPGRAAEPGQEVMRLRYNQVSPDYFALTGTRLLSGRTFSHADSGSAPRVALVNQTMAHQQWPAGDALGRWIRVNGTDTQIVGVVEDGIIANIHERPEQFLYFPFAQAPVGEVTFMMETAVDAATLLDAGKRELRAADPHSVVLLTTTLRQHVRDALYSDWLAAFLSITIAGLGIALAAAGLFGVVMHGVNRRLRELGVRVALGAGNRALVGIVLKQALALAGSGAILGVALAIAAGRLLAGMLYGVRPHDAISLALGVAIVLLVTAAASVYPAWKATRVDPATVLRAE
ncbi:MAG: ABC transporter permease, partial [Acidobacteria bacterium]|nr:ABC transporter permease [Acidobacteriota bacterium]